MNEVSNTNYPDQINILEISSDGIRGQLIQEYLSKNPTKTFQEAFDSTGKGKTLKNTWDKAFNDLLTEVDPKKINIIYIDKNFPPNTLTAIQKDAQKWGSSVGKNGLAAILYPKITNPIAVNNYLSFPFSFDYFIQCYYRLKNRKNHETLDGEKNPTFYLISFMFLKFYRQFNYTQLEGICDFKAAMSFTSEVHTNEEMKEVGELLNKVFRNSFGKEVIPKNDQHVQNFIAYIDANYSIDKYSDTFDQLQVELTECKLYLSYSLSYEIYCRQVQKVSELINNIRI